MGSKYFNVFLCLCCGIALPFSSCKKSVNARGYTLDIYTGMGIADIEVTVQEAKKTAFSDASKMWKSTSDSNGEFNVGFVGHRSKKYQYFITLPFYSDADTTRFYERAYLPILDNGIATHNIQWEGANDLLLKMAPAAKVILITNNPSNKPVDAITFSWLAMGIEFGILSNAGGINKINAVNMPSNGQSILKTVLTSNGVTKTTVDTFATIPFQITRHEITL